MAESFIDRIGTEPFGAVFRFWKARRDGPLVPLKRSFDPTEMPARWLPYLTIYQSVGDRFLIRLVGTAVVDIDGVNPTGKYLEDVLPPDMAAGRRALFKDVLDRQLPALYGGRYHLADGRHLTFSRLLLPVRSKGTRPDHIIAVIVFGSYARPDPTFSMLSSVPVEVPIIWCRPEDLAA